jgi:transcriptional regulator with XRE-family HTH domain
MRWLGAAASAKKSKGHSKHRIPAATLAHQIQIIYLIGNLLTSAPDIATAPEHRVFLGNLADYINRKARGSINLLADITGIWSGAIRRLLRGSKPVLGMLCQLCSRLNIPLLDLLTGEVKEEAIAKKHLFLERDTPLPGETTPWGEVESKLHIALRESPPPSLNAVAHRMGHHPPRIKKHFPELCEQIISRYKEYLGSKHPSPKEIRKALRAVLKEQPPPSLQRVLRRLGCWDTGYFYYHHYPDLCFEVARRFRENRNIRFDKDRDHKRLRKFLIEEPPPSFSEVARRLGHKREFIRKKFPELSKAVTSRYIYYRDALRKERAVRLRQKIREAISNITALGLYASEARVRGYVKSHMEHLGHASTFKQAFQEIKSEMVSST